MAQQKWTKELKLQFKWQKDLYHKSSWVSKLIGCLIKKGHKEKAELWVLESFNILKAQKKFKPFLIFSEALEIIRPNVGLVSKRVGKKIHQIPIPLWPLKPYKIAMRWILESIDKRTERNIVDRISNELLAIVFEKRSLTLKKRNEFFSIITYNRTYLHFRWI